MTPQHASPLQIPEIIRNLSHFVTLTDAVVCARVCKSWTNAFVSTIWHTIDFGNQDELLRMDAKILERHGNHIRVAKNVKNLDHIKMLIVSNATKLRKVIVSMMATQEFYAYFGNILRKNNATLQSIEMTQSSTKNAHFPRLESWSLRADTSATGSTEIPIDEIRDGVIKYCPSLKGLRTGVPASMATELLVNVFDGLNVLCCLQQEISAEFVMAIFRHRETLRQIYTFLGESDPYTSDSVPDVVRNPNEAAGWIIQSIPQHCSHLTILKFPSYEMNMDDIEKAPWSCHNLKTLCIRISGLDTKEKIHRAIQLWDKARTSMMDEEEKEEEEFANTQEDMVLLPSDKSIEARVARHLLNFDKLRTVWLGWKIWAH
ncbi:hypothetical protein BGX31_010925 [Mortierella sp. GBA43]|nr:hypothetical protein BGX31_010925 [Mortierella sp. GBA43]